MQSQLNIFKKKNIKSSLVIHERSTPSKKLTQSKSYMFCFFALSCYSSFIVLRPLFGDLPAASTSPYWMSCKSFGLIMSKSSLKRSVLYFISVCMAGLLKSFWSSEFSVSSVAYNYTSKSTWSWFWSFCSILCLMGDWRDYESIDELSLSSIVCLRAYLILASVDSIPNSFW